MSDRLQRLGEWSGFGIHKQYGHYISLPAYSGKSYDDSEVNARRIASTLSIVGAGAVVYGAYELAQAANLV